MGNDLQVYDDFVAKHEAAYRGFASVYESKNPKPALGAVRRDLVSMMVVIALTIVMGASVIVSGSRTIQEFGGEGVGVVAFVMIDLGVMVYALFRARRNANPKRLQDTVKWATTGLILTFFIGIAANIDATLKAHEIKIDAVFVTIINLAVAVSAPALSFISSDILAVELMATDIKKREAQHVYDEQSVQWLDGLNRSWQGQQKQWGIVRLDLAPPPQIPADNSSNLIKFDQISSRHKPSPRLEKALSYLREHPDQLETPSRDLQPIIGISYGTISKAQIIIRNEQDES